LDFEKLARILVPKTDTIVGVYYFTALQTWKPDKVARHRLFIRANELKGVHIVYGEFKQRDRLCSICKKEYVGREEKQTDVNIAIHLFRSAIQDRHDIAVIVSGDSDQIPAIQAVKALYPTKQVRVAIPIGRRADQLIDVCDSYSRIRELQLKSCQLDTEIDIGGGEKLIRPESWV
jgi:uncharacterized LabA/DUF88 family protein